MTGDAFSKIVYVTIRRASSKEWDADGGNTKIGRYEVKTGKRTVVHYPIEPTGDGDWIGLAGITAMPNGGFWVMERDKTLVKDPMSTIAENSIWTAEKLEGFAVSADHQLYAVTDNDGVDDASGETVFLHLGEVDTFGSH